MNKKLLFAILSIATAVNAQAQPPKINGIWHSVAIEPSGPIYATRTFTIADQAWRVAFRTFADAQGKQPLFTINVNGVYVLGNESKIVKGAYEGIFPATQRHITAYSPAGVNMLASMGCQLTQGQKTSLLTQSCGFVPSLMQAMGEYDLVSVQNGQLFFGDRSGDLTKARPEKLTPYAVVRQH